MGGDLVSGVEASRTGDRTLLLPVLGPWIDIAGRGKCVSPPQVATDTSVPADPCVEETANQVGIVVSGVGQTIGAVLFFIGLPEHAELIEDEPGRSHAAKKKSPVFSWSIAPLQHSHSTGLAAVGTF